jgi:hypothetical protein
MTIMLLHQSHQKKKRKKKKREEKRVEAFSLEHSETKSNISLIKHRFGVILCKKA